MTYRFDTLRRVDHPQPPRISRTVRYGIATVVGLLVAVVLGLLFPSIDEGDAGPWLVLITMSVGIVVIALTLGNNGFRPRIQGQYLEVSTILGRQSLDLAALQGVRMERGRSGYYMLRLRDPVTDVVIPMSFPAPVHRALRDALDLAGHRGVVLPRRVTSHFGLPPMPGAPRNGFSILPMVVGFLAGASLIGLITGLVVAR